MGQLPTWALLSSIFGRADTDCPLILQDSPGEHWSSFFTLSILYGDQVR